MKNRIILVIFLFITMITQIFAMGKKEEDAVKTQNDEWVLCITNLDITSLPAEKAFIANVILKELVDRIDSISYRTRISPEYAYYEEFAWTRARSAAARAVSAKMDERSAEIFKGEPGWRYRRNLTRIDNDLIRLRANLEEIENNAPLINREPVFKLTNSNHDLSFPTAPAAGGEFRFCTSQNADAFLTGSIKDFHGRFFMTLKLYAQYTQSFIWEDSVIFSQDDIDEAIVDITEKLLILLAGNLPSFLVIQAEPAETLLLINQSFAGRGSTDLIELPPSTIVINASAPNHESVTIEADLAADEITKIKINLIPVNFAEVEIAQEIGAKVYHGALYVGEAPLTLRLPVDHLAFIELENDNNIGSLVFQTPRSSEYMLTFSVNTRLPMESGRVDKHRQHYYWAWGSTWIAGIAAWISYQTYTEARNSINYGASHYGIFNSEFGNDINMMSYISMGTLVVAGTVGVYSIYRFFRYLHTANRGATPVAPEKGGN